MLSFTLANNDNDEVLKLTMKYVFERQMPPFIFSNTMNLTYNTIFKMDHRILWLHFKIEKGVKKIKCGKISFIEEVEIVRDKRKVLWRGTANHIGHLNNLTNFSK